ncbi:PDZ domain-containing protein [Luteolibacter pohnpeiensis]|uniref:PDZ domain-containing protein n=1 Tax=Luteolibacter pohnpeiensis TaxID=454153 RepID=A0A934S3N0_9BACT|nr:PDZ domain-containing protein [Luteolibacter pohnpeiensis]MBK1881717.1 PDZ domain-containing protein [Luteolibacter pohnpeiensis]
MTKEVPEMLRMHLGLKTGEGVMVNGLVPGAPAITSGFAKYDIILKVADTAIGSPEELSNSLANYKAGDSVNIDLIHTGDRITKSVTLGQRPTDLDLSNNDSLDPQMAQRAQDSPPNLDFERLGGFTPEQADRIRRIIERNLQNPRRLQMSMGLSSHMEDMMRQMEDQFSDMNDMIDPQQGGNGNFEFNSGSSLSIVDDDGSIEVRSNNGDTKVTVRDQDNKEVWSGPWNTDDDKSKAPEDIRKRIEKFNLSGGGNGKAFHLQFGTRSGR